MEQQITIGVIGGGAAGMVAAITAARAGAKVTLLEGGERVGKKLLATGNGKCNLGNRNLSEADYNGADQVWLKRCLEQFGPAETEKFFQDLGLWIKDKNGYLYPLAEQAAVVVDALRIGLSQVGVDVVTECKVHEIKVSHLFTVITMQGKTFRFDRVILACGSKAAPKTGSDGSGYRLVQKLGHRLIPVVPALVQLRCRETFLKEIAGVRAEAKLTVLHGRRKADGHLDKGQDCIQEYGELQLTDYGISGIPVFQLSRKVNYILFSASPEVEISIDFLPDYTEEQMKSLVKKRLNYMKEGEGTDHLLSVEEFFTGILNKKLMYLFIKLAGLKRDAKAAETEESKLRHVFELCRDFRVHVTGSNSYDQAQVCAGGVDTTQVDTNMQSKLLAGLYFAGELLDVDGRCGGYNLHWAWCSGYLAGRNAAEMCKQN
ncbi:MAG: aminoacetone oxidase family FAD-binding enzyme [Lachnospiraceae bacterium]|nr:aminoacetone oxidase family FAD-binding enzyme [Lachnospiraceae bacterium]